MTTTEFPSPEPAPTQRRRQTPSALLHRIVLVLALSVGAGALVYNALSILSGEGGLVALPGLHGSGWNGDAPTWRG